MLTLQFCVNYGGRAEIVDAAAAIAADVAAGKLRPEKITEKVFAGYLDEPGIPEVDLFVRSSGEQRLSNFLLWQSAYAELVFLDTLWPDFDRRHLWHACEIYASRDRRYGGAVPNPLPAPDDDTGGLAAGHHSFPRTRPRPGPGSGCRPGSGGQNGLQARPAPPSRGDQHSLPEATSTASLRRKQFHESVLSAT